MNKILPVDIIMPLFFDLFGTFYLFYAFKEPHVSWRGIVYKVKKGGFIEDVSFNEAALYDEAIMDEEIDDEYEDQNREWDEYPSQNDEYLGQNRDDNVMWGQKIGMWVKNK